jgi:hypothetical protein
MQADNFRAAPHNLQRTAAPPLASLPSCHPLGGEPNCWASGGIMSNNDFLDEEDKYLEFDWTIVERHYNSKDTFISHYRAIPTDEIKNQFLKVISYYKFLVREFNYQHPEEFDVDFASQTYKFVGLIAKNIR